MVDFDYVTVFDLTEKALFEYGSRHEDKELIIRNLTEFKEFETRELGDDDFYEKLIFVIFYSGFRASTVTARRAIIKNHFPSIKQVADYSKNEIDRIIADDRMIQNTAKINACVYNAKIFKRWIEKYGSIGGYIKP